MPACIAITAIKAAAPDWIYVTGYTKDLVLFRKQMSDLKVDAPIITIIQTCPCHPFKAYFIAQKPKIKRTNKLKWTKTDIILMIAKLKVVKKV